MYLLELAQAQNATECYRIINEGRMFQKEQGSSNGQTTIRMSRPFWMILLRKRDIFLHRITGLPDIYALILTANRLMKISKEHGILISPMLSFIGWHSAENTGDVD